MILRSSFQARTAAVLILLLSVVVGALYLAVQAATGVAVRNQAREQLEVGTRVFEQVLQGRGQLLHEAVQVLSADFGFKAAVASGDTETIRSALANHGARINAGLVMMFDLEGRLQVSSGGRLDEQTAARLSTQLRQQQGKGSRSFLMPVGDTLYLLVQASVRAPVPIARVMMGFRVDQAFAAELRELTHLDLSLVAAQDGLPDIWISTLPDAVGARLRSGLQSDPQTPDALLRVGPERYLGERLVLVQGDDFQVQALLHKSLRQAQQAFAPLYRHILLIALAALLASLGGALVLARNVSKPVRQLAEVAERVGQGDYQVPLRLERSDELGRLAKSFQAMQQGIAERERQLAHNALHDALTGLPNRTLIVERIGSAVAAGRPMALLYLGVGNLSAVSDSCGPGSGDLAMQQLSRRLQATLRPGDSLARVTADELLLLLENADSDSAVAAGDRLQQVMLAPLSVGSVRVALECAIGIAACPADGDDAQSLLRRARIAMQDAAQLPGRLQVYQQGRDAAHQRQIRLIRDLPRAPEQGELLLHYQPKLDLCPGGGRQAEALLRWQHPQLGMVSPGEFIPLAERTGSIRLLTAWVIEEAMRQLQEWNARGLQVQLSLNISTEDLLDPELPDRVGRLLAYYRVPAQQLTFEITESGVMLDPAAALRVLHGLRGCGIRLSVDDFGTGYSSLAQLKRMPVQELKIDQSFIRELDDTSEDAVIVRSTIEMSHSLGLKVVAEGVELARSLQLLRHWRCDTVQGYLISKPLSGKDFEAWVAQPLNSTQSLV
ncbi:putative bifunctional diguanylate cyclase/phosphodiesterase [Pseudomonas sp. MBLB4123]|uniref:putative bifunctional diguanylate cyclase/phosphodiesterase n=1 Tax=Pseudomonas sp. MBLB4123 TaxID=3451557 RepID=UPI003F75188E